MYCELGSLITESDVEQKFIYPFLRSETPVGLGLKDAELLTKHILRKKLIDKGAKQKYYYPDYLIAIRGIPVLVVEAKSPDESLETGYSEARLYAQEVNASFPHKKNSCQYVISSNGKETWAGYTDQAEPVLRLQYSDFSTENKSFCDLISFCSHNILLGIANKLYVDARGKSRFNSPVSQLGGKRVQNEEMVENSFGRTFVFENRAIFDPETEAERATIVKNAYVSSPKREQHADPIFKEIKRFELPSQKNATFLPTDKPNDLIEKLSEKILNNQDAYSLMLLIGNVGSGKTTFIRYFKNVFLENDHQDLAEKCEWIFINMNSAPISSKEIYEWLMNQIISSIKEEHTELDFDDIAVIKRVFRREILSFNKGIGSLLQANELEYNKELYKTIQDLLNDTNKYLSALLYFFKENYAKIPIIVLDNCDKRNKDEQLLMFEVSQWLRTQYKCIVILPMRDTTYDLYKSEPPLDTVVRDLVFRIDPPDLLKVLQARLDYITRITEQTSNIYILDNNVKVEVKRGELIEYFKLIMMAIREDRWIANIFYRLTNKNIRNGIQIFEDFCKSGHMKTNDILAMRVFGAEAQVPSFKFVNVLLRKNRRYYNGDESNFINLFGSDYDDDFPDPFVRVDVLNWLQNMGGIEGPSGDKGLHSVTKMEQNLQVYGHSIDVIQRELVYLIKKGLVFCENTTAQPKENDLIKITIPGALHINMLTNVAYLAACAEDTLFKNTVIMTNISSRLKLREGGSKLISALNAKDLVDYLIDYRNQYYNVSSELIAEEDFITPYDMCLSSNAIDQWVKSDTVLCKIVGALSSFTKGMKVNAKVLNKSNGGIICSISDDEVKGFTAVMNAMYALPSEVYEKVLVGDIIQCEIIDFDFQHNSFQLKYLTSPIENQPDQFDNLPESN